MAYNDIDAIPILAAEMLLRLHFIADGIVVAGHLPWRLLSSIHFINCESAPPFSYFTACHRLYHKFIIRRVMNGIVPDGSQRSHLPQSNYFVRCYKALPDSSIRPVAAKCRRRLKIIDDLWLSLKDIHEILKSLEISHIMPIIYLLPQEACFYSKLYFHHLNTEKYIILFHHYKTRTEWQKMSISKYQHRRVILGRIDMRNLWVCLCCNRNNICTDKYKARITIQINNTRISAVNEPLRHIWQYCYGTFR